MSGAATFLVLITIETGVALELSNVFSFMTPCMVFVYEIILSPTVSLCAPSVSGTRNFNESGLAMESVMTVELDLSGILSGCCEKSKTGQIKKIRTDNTCFKDDKLGPKIKLILPRNN